MICHSNFALSNFDRAWVVPYQKMTHQTPLPYQILTKRGFALSNFDIAALSNFDKALYKAKVVYINKEQRTIHNSLKGIA